jgi:uncharacterized protein YvpB
MYSLTTPGLGVYHGPIAELSSQYTDRTLDLTGASLNDILYLVSIGKPVWVINTSIFNTVPKEYWKTWITPNGKMQITQKEHSVVITGYDESYIYIANPLGSSEKVSIENFKAGWEQMGNQAVVIF